MEGSELRGSQLGKIFLEARKRREEAQRRVMIEETPVDEPELRGSQLGGWVLESQRHQEARRQQIIEETPVDEPKEDVSSIEEIVDVEEVNPIETRSLENMHLEEAISVISNDIQPLLEIALGELEDIIGKFSFSADANDVRGMREELEGFLQGMENITDLLLQFHTIITNTFLKTKRGIDAQTIISRTFSRDNVKAEVRELLDLLKGTSEVAMRLRYDIPGSKELKELLQSVFNYGETHFSYEAPEVEVDMDVSRDEEMARELSESLRRKERRVRFESIGAPIRDVPRMPRTTTTPRRTGIGSGVRLGGVEDRSLRHLEASVGHLEASVPTDEPDIGLGTLDLVRLQEIAELYDLPDYERMSKIELINYIQRNIDRSILRDIFRERFSKYAFNDIPIIWSE